MEILRTPDDRFDSLPGYPFESHYVDVPRGDGEGTLRMHCVDEGPRDGEVVLLLHGEPSWSYLYRKMIPIIVDAGHRAVAVDLVGFGKSDKPASRTDHTYQRHVDWTWAVVDSVGLDAITLVCQDWGGLIGLRLVAEHPERFARVVAANTFLPTGDVPAGEAFMQWLQLSQEIEEFPAGGIVSMATTTDLAPEVVAAYDAPFPDESFKEGARQLPALVPITPDDPASEANRAAWEVLSKWEKPFLTAFSDSDPITRGADQALQSMIPGARGVAHTTIVGGGHFLQEDRGEDLARAVVTFMTVHPPA